MADREPGVANAVEGPASRRRFMELVGGAGAATAVSILAAACGDDEGGEGDDVGAPGQVEEETPAGEPGSDLEIVKYVLFLEFFEEIFYDKVLESEKVQDTAVRKLIEDTYRNEKEHAEALTAIVRQLAGTPVAQPKTKFGSVIAGGEQKIVETAAVLENLGAGAYLGQADKIQNNRILELALSIHTVEARHAAAFNEVAGFGFSAGKLEGAVPDGAFGKPMTREEVLNEAAPFLIA
jgi:rubrerythrin